VSDYEESCQLSASTFSFAVALPTHDPEL
jgi:hypothetical protein